MFKPSSYFAVALAETGKWLAVAEDPDKLRIVNPRNPGDARSVPVGGEVVDITFMPDTQSALLEVAVNGVPPLVESTPMTNEHTRIVLVDLTAGRVAWSYDLPKSQAGPTWKAISAPGNRIAIGGENRQGVVLDTLSGRELIKIDFSALVRSAAFDPSGNRVAFGSADGVVQFVDVDTKRVVGVIRSQGDVWRVAFVGFGAFLAVESDQSLDVFATNPFGLLCQKDGRNLSNAEWSDVGGRWSPPVSCQNWRQSDKMPTSVERMKSTGD